MALVCVVSPGRRVRPAGCPAGTGPGAGAASRPRR